MSPIAAAIVRRKLGHIVAALDLLRSVADLGLDEYRARVWQRKGTARLLSDTSPRRGCSRRLDRSLASGGARPYQASA